jgi:hypothetical protein
MSTTPILDVHFSTRGWIDTWPMGIGAGCPEALTRGTSVRKQYAWDEQSRLVERRLYFGSTPVQRRLLHWEGLRLVSIQELDEAFADGLDEEGCPAVHWTWVDGRIESGAVIRPGRAVRLRTVWSWAPDGRSCVIEERTSEKLLAREEVTLDSLRRLLRSAYVHIDTGKRTLIEASWDGPRLERAVERSGPNLERVREVVPEWRSDGRLSVVRDSADDGAPWIVHYGEAP